MSLFFVGLAGVNHLTNWQREKERNGDFMLLKNSDKIAEISYLIPPCLNMFGVSDDQNELVLRKIYGLQLKKMRLMRGYTQTKVAKAVNCTF